MFSNFTVSHDFTSNKAPSLPPGRLRAIMLGHDATFQNNAGAIDFENNQVTHDAVFQNNTGSVTVKGNTYAVLQCQNDMPKATGQCTS